MVMGLVALVFGVACTLLLAKHVADLNRRQKKLAELLRQLGRAVELINDPASNSSELAGCQNFVRQIQAESQGIADEIGGEA